VNKEQEHYWSERYEKGNTGWDVGAPTTPIKSYIDSLTDKSTHLLIPGAGNGYEAEYAWNCGFVNTHILDISKIPLDAFKKRNPSFPSAQLHHSDFFAHEGEYDLILEQTFFCSFVPSPENRKAYAKKMSDLLCEGGKLVGVLFSFPRREGNMDKRPFGGNKKEYLSYLNPVFKDVQIEECYNSIAPRAGNEFFVQATK